MRCHEASRCRAPTAFLRFPQHWFDIPSKRSNQSRSHHQSRSAYLSSFLMTPCLACLWLRKNLGSMPTVDIFLGRRLFLIPFLWAFWFWLWFVWFLDLAIL